MDPIPILIVALVVLAIPALYFIITKKSKGEAGTLRKDATERPELTGTEQYKRRDFK